MKSGRDEVSQQRSEQCLAEQRLADQCLKQQRDVRFVGYRRYALLLALVGGLGLADAQAAPGSVPPLSAPSAERTQAELLNLLLELRGQIEEISPDATGAEAERLASLIAQEQRFLTQLQLERLQRENAALKAQLAAQRQQPDAATRELTALEQRLAAVTDEQKNLISQVEVVAEQHAMILGSSAPAETHVVVEGDILSELAQTYLGSAELWPELLAANPDLIDADQLLPGTRLTLPHND